jgi:long-chain acyl-CoA synthetase
MIYNGVELNEVRKIRDLKDMLNSSAAIYGEKAAFLVKKQGNGSYIPVSYNQFKNDTDAFGTALIDLGLKDKSIAIIGENRYEWCVSYLSVVNGTGLVVPIDKELPSNEIFSLLERAEVSAIIYSDRKKETVEKALEALGRPIIVINMDAKEDTEKYLSMSVLMEKGRKLLQEGDKRFVEAEIDPEKVLILLYTSATTSKSKAVMLTHKNICSNLEAMCQMTYIGPEDIFLSVLPIHHAYECTCGFLCPIYRGCTIAICEGLRHITKNLQESKATMMLAVPLILETMYKRVWDTARKNGMDKKLKTALKISKLLLTFKIDKRRKLFSKIHDNFGGHIRLFISGAAAIDPVVSKGFRDFGFNILQGYGLTECSPIVTLNRPTQFNDFSAGVPLPNLDVKIDNPDSDGIGEIIVKGDSVMKGYYKDEEANRLAFTEDGYFKTGDYAYKNDKNFIFITGRKKNVIVTKNGKNIFPEEIETLLGRKEYIKESMVYAKEAGDDLIVAASIYPNYEKMQDENIDISDEAVDKLISEYIREVNRELATYKFIKDYHIRKEDFVKTTTGKIKRYMEKTK